MFKKVMEKVFLWFFILVLVVGIVSASGSWSDINNKSNSLKNKTVVAYNNSINKQAVSQKESNSKAMWTVNFYIALALILLIVTILSVFIWLWIRGSKNSWD